MLLVYAILLGFTSARLAKSLDGWMDRGGIFDFIRIWKVKQLDLDFSKTQKEMEKLSYFDRQEAYIVYYWEVAKQDKSFTAWICVDCISVRINLLLFLFFLGFMIFTGNLILIVPCFLVGLASNNFFL